MTTFSHLTFTVFTWKSLRFPRHSHAALIGKGGEVSSSGAETWMQKSISRIGCSTLIFHQWNSSLWGSLAGERNSRTLQVEIEARNLSYASSGLVCRYSYETLSLKRNKKVWADKIPWNWIQSALSSSLQRAASRSEIPSNRKAEQSVNKNCSLAYVCGKINSCHERLSSCVDYVTSRR